MNLPSDYYGSDVGMWTPPAVTKHVDPGHVYELSDSGVESLRPPSDKEKKKVTADRLNATAISKRQTSASLEKITGETQEALIALREQSYCCLCMQNINNDDVNYWEGGVPLNEVSEWFTRPDHQEVFEETFVRDNGRGLFWTSAMAWLGDHYPIYKDEEDSPAGRGLRPRTRAATWAPAWHAYVAKAVTWSLAKHNQAVLRKAASHTGGHLADYARGELLGRSGRPPTKWVVVHNGVYKAMWHMNKQQIPD